MSKSNNLMKVYLGIGRILLAAIFILSGFNKIAHWGMTEGYMASKGIPFIPVLLFIAMLIEIIGGLSILFGYRGRFFGTLIFLYLIPVTFLFHDFWNFAGAEQMGQMANFLKNIAIMGGLIQYACFQDLYAPLRERKTIHPENTILRQTPITT